MGVVQAEHRVGDIVAGRYQLTRVFAKGGMGWLWEAYDTKLKRKVAAKLLSKKYAEDGAARQRFEREAMSVAKLSSAHVVQVFDYGIEGDTPYIVMELLTGEDLRRRLKAKKLLSLGEMYRIVAQVAAGLTEAHKAGVVHRDLKPANVFLAQTQTGEIVKLLDFGVAKPEGPPVDGEVITGEGSVVGTPQYMSPEQIRALPNIDFRSDLFSLGVIIYRCLTGRLPFEGKTVNDLQVNIATKEVPPPSEIADWLPPEIDAFMLRALGKGPEARFQSARQMTDAFATLIPGSVPGFDAPSLSGALAPRASWPGVPAATASAAGVSQSGFPTAPSYPSLTGETTDVGSMSSTAQAAILAAADAEIALQQKPSWGKRFGLIAAVLCVILLCIGIGTVLFGDGEPQAQHKPEPTGTTEVPVAPAPPTPDPEPVTTAEPSPPDPEPATEPQTNDVKPQPPVRPAAPPPPKPPPPPPPPPSPDKPWDPFKNRK